MQVAWQVVIRASAIQTFDKLYPKQIIKKAGGLYEKYQF
jgi:hypothetical protein